MLSIGRGAGGRKLLSLFERGVLGLVSLVVVVVVVPAVDMPAAGVVVPDVVSPQK